MKFANLKLVPAIALVFSMGVSAVYAQAAGPNGGQITSHQGKHNRQVKRDGGPIAVLMKTMKVTPDQKKQIGELFKSNAQQLKALKTKDGADKQAMAADRKKIQDATDSKLQTILKPDQYSTWQAYQTASKMRRFNEDLRALRAAQPTDAEMTAIKKLKAETRNKALTGIAANPTDSAAVESAKQTALADYKTKLAGILSADQMTAYNNALASGQGAGGKGKRGRKGGNNGSGV